MKRKLVLVSLLFILVLSVFPVAAFAAQPADIFVNVRNATGGTVELDLVDANGNHIYKTLEAGISQFELTDGIYSYYAVTACGNLAGTLNLGTTKTLYLDCVENAPVVQVEKGCTWYIDYNDNTYTKWQTAKYDNPRVGEFFEYDMDNVWIWMWFNGFDWNCSNTVLQGDLANGFNYGIP